MRTMLIEDYEKRLEQAEQDITKQCLHDKNELDTFKTKACDDQMEELKNDLFERKKKTLIELDASWRKKMKNLRKQLEEEESRKCETDKSKILVTEKEQCATKMINMRAQHDDHKSEQSDFIDDLKISMS